MKKYWHQFKDSFVLIAHGISMQFTKINGDYGCEYQTCNKVIQRIIENCSEFQCGSIVVVEDSSVKEVEEMQTNIPELESPVISVVEENEVAQEIAQQDRLRGQEAEHIAEGMTLEQAITYMVDNYGMTRTISKRESVLAYASKMGVEIVIQS